MLGDFSLLACAVVRIAFRDEDSVFTCSGVIVSPLPLPPPSPIDSERAGVLRALGWKPRVEKPLLYVLFGNFLLIQVLITNQADRSPTGSCWLVRGVR